MGITEWKKLVDYKVGQKGLKIESSTRAVYKVDYKVQQKRLEGETSWLT